MENDNSIQKNEYNIFKLVRETRRISPDQLAKRVGVSRSYIYAIENDQRFPSEKVYQKLLKELNISDEIIRTFGRRSKKYNSYEKILGCLLKLI